MHFARNCEGTEQLRNVKHIKVHHRPEVHLLRIRYEIITCFLWIALHLSMTVMPFFTDMPKNQASGFFAPSALFSFPLPSSVPETSDKLLIKNATST